jgi:LacI family transcriptional regulator
LQEISRVNIGAAPLKDLKKQRKRFHRFTQPAFMLYRHAMTNKMRMEEVGAHAGVSIATVSRVLSQPQRVRPETRQLVLDAIDKLHYVPNAAGRALASGRTRTIGCIIPTLDHAIFARSTHALQVSFADAGYQLLVASHNYDPVVELALVQAFQQRGVDALVLVGAEHHKQTWGDLKAWSKPALLTWSCDERLPSVGFDNSAIAALATSHLLELGHQRIGMISGHLLHNDRARARAQGYRAQLEAKGIRPRPHWFTEQTLNVHGGRLGLLELFKGKDRPTALICGNDLLAIGALLQAQRQGLNVPNDLSICGIDNHELTGEINPGLTTVSLPTQDLGRIAATQILQALSGEPIARQSLLPFELMVRASTAPPSMHGTQNSGQTG